MKSKSIQSELTTFITLKFSEYQQNEIVEETNILAVPSNISNPLKSHFFDKILKNQTKMYFK